MGKYISKQITNDDGGSAGAWKGKELVVNLDTGKAHVREGGWADAQHLADGKGECVPPVLWQEPDVWALECAESVFTEIATRMCTLEKLPGTDVDNPFLGGTLEDIPDPS